MGGSSNTATLFLCSLEIVTMDNFLSACNYDTLLEVYCIAWYTKFKRFPARSDKRLDRATLERRIDLLRRHR